MDVKFSPQSPMMADYLRHLFPPDAAGNLKVKSTNAITSFFRSQDVADLHECIAYLYRPASRRITRSGRHVHPVACLYGRGGDRFNRPRIRFECGVRRRFVRHGDRRFLHRNG